MVASSVSSGAEARWLRLLNKEATTAMKPFSVRLFERKEQSFFETTLAVLTDEEVDAYGLYLARHRPHVYERFLAYLDERATPPYYLQPRFRLSVEDEEILAHRLRSLIRCERDEATSRLQMIMEQQRASVVRPDVHHLS